MHFQKLSEQKPLKLFLILYRLVEIYPGYEIPNVIKSVYVFQKYNNNWQPVLFIESHSRSRSLHIFIAHIQIPIEQKPLNIILKHLCYWIPANSIYKRINTVKIGSRLLRYLKKFSDIFFNHGAYTIINNNSRVITSTKFKEITIKPNHK